MCDFDTALDMVRKHLDDSLEGMAPNASKLSISSSENYDFGWVFFYNYIDNSGAKIIVAGNAPLIFENKTGKIITTGTAYPTNYYIQMYLLTGNPQSQLKKHVKITDWEVGASAISATQVLRQYTGIGLADAKTIIEAGLSGEQPIFEATTIDAAQQLVPQLARHGFNAICSPRSKL